MEKNKNRKLLSKSEKEVQRVGRGLWWEEIVEKVGFFQLVIM